MHRLRPTLEYRRGDELVAHAVASPEATWFQGHFPGAPLLPGVALLALVEEALLALWPEAGQPAVEVASYRRVRFRQKVEPGANLRVRARRVDGERFRFTVELGGVPACTGECTVVAKPDAPRSETARLPASDDARRFSPDGTSLADVVARAAGLCAQGARGSPISICVATEDRAEVAAAVLAALSGGIEAIFPAALTPEAMATTWTARHFSHWMGPVEWLSQVAGAIRVGETPPAAQAGPLTLAGLDIPRIFLQTGGSTGEPRMWPKSARNLLDEVAMHARALQVDADDYIVATAPPHHIYGLLFSVLLPLCSGATVERVSPFFPQEIAERIARAQATILVATPVHLRALASVLSAPHRLRLVLSSSAPLAAADAAAFHARTGLWPLEVYGSTETGGVAVRRQDVPECPWAPLPGVLCRGEGDVLAVRSSYVSAGVETEADGFFRTADLANLRPDGRIELLGRSDGVVKVGGRRVSLPEIEKAILALEGVEDAVVLARPSPSGRGQEIVAVVASSRSADEIGRELRERLPSPAWPRRLRCVAAIPVTSSGKRDRAMILGLLDVAQGEAPQPDGR
jgi:3-hydroxymyristoyl/3-hydroxydecanoyl-(acyl carrier protein) dehydratase